MFWMAYTFRMNWNFIRGYVIFGLFWSKNLLKKTSLKLQGLIKPSCMEYSLRIPLSEIFRTVQPYIQDGCSYDY